MEAVAEYMAARELLIVALPHMKITFRASDAEAAGPLDVHSTDTVLAIALRLFRDCQGHTKLPQIVWDGVVLPYDACLADQGLFDGAEAQVVWQSGAQRPPRVARSHADVIEARPGLGAAGLRQALAGIRDPERMLDLAGCRFIDAPVSDLLPPSLLALDIRQCRLSGRDVEAIFAALPPGVMELRASRNAISRKAVRSLAHPRGGARQSEFRVLDVGYSDLEDGTGDLGVDELLPLVGPCTEELGLGDLATPELVAVLAPCCPALRRLDVSFGGWDASDGAPAWAALGKHCPLLEHVEASWCCCDAAGFRNLVAGCPRLRALRLGTVPGAALAAAAGSCPLDFLAVGVSAVEDVAHAAQLDVRWLSLSVSPFADDRPPPFPAAPLAQALRDARATDIELQIPGVTAECLAAVGPRLRAVRVTQDGDEDDPQPLLPALAAAAPHCPNLLEFDVSFWERVAGSDVARVAAHCPLLQTVWLNADVREFQVTPIDEGVRALGRCCADMRHLDLYDRPLEAAAATLAEACQGWPRLRYLCAAGTGEWQDGPEQEALPRALARHCPGLQELVLYPVPSSWREIMALPCPLVVWSEGS